MRRETTATLRRDSPLPLYAQIARHLREELVDTPDREGPLFTEDEVSRRFGVHRLTARQALRELEREGLVVRRRGLGTFRAPHKLRGEPLYLESFIDHWSMQGRRVRAELLGVERTLAEGRTATALGALDGDPVVRIRRRRFIDDEPLVLDHIFLSLELGLALRPDDLVQRTLHRAIQLRTGRMAADADLLIEATVAGESDAGLLAVHPGSPLFLRHIVLRDASRLPLSYGWSLYRADLFSYSLTVPLPPERAYAPDLPGVNV